MNWTWALGQRKWVALIVVAGCLSLTAQLATTHAQAGGAPTAGDFQQFQANVHALASANMPALEAPPKSAEVVSTTRGEFLSARGAGDNLDPTARIYVVQVEATFVGYGSKAPDPCQSPARRSGLCTTPLRSR